VKVTAIAVIGLCLIAPRLFAQENTIKNGDFSRGKMGWNMEPGVRIREYPEPTNPTNRLVEVTLDKKDNRSLSSKFDIKSKTTALKIKLRIKPASNFASAIPDSNQVTVRITRPNKGSTFTGWKIPAGNEWQNFDWDFSAFEGERNFVFSLEFHPGTGSVLLDDIIITEL